MQKYILDVPFSEKDEAKSDGARWDASINKWVVYSNCSNFYYLVDRFNGYDATPKTNVWKFNKYNKQCLIVDD